IFYPCPCSSENDCSVVFFAVHQTNVCNNFTLSNHTGMTLCLPSHYTISARVAGCVAKKRDKLHNQLINNQLSVLYHEIRYAFPVHLTRPRLHELTREGHHKGNGYTECDYGKRSTSYLPAAYSKVVISYTKETAFCASGYTPLLYSRHK